MNGTALERKSYTRFLGVEIEETLKWERHIQKVYEKISKLCGILYLTRHMLTTDARKQIYYSLVYPHLTYCHVVWGATGITKSKRLVTVQKKIIRTIAGIGRAEHTNSFFLDIFNYF